MTDQEINMAIAEVCGWSGITVQHSPWDETQQWVVGIKPRSVSILIKEPIPPYVADLNAMHDAELMLGERGDLGVYFEQLSNITERDETPMFQATARQRAEAFLRTIGKWA